MVIPFKEDLRKKIHHDFYGYRGGQGCDMFLWWRPLVCVSSYMMFGISLFSICWTLAKNS